MLNGSKWDLKVVHPSLVAILGSFAPNGVNPIDNTANMGTGFTVARTGVGLYDVTFNDKTGDLVAANGQVQLNAFADSEVQFGAYDKANKKITIRNKTAGVAADIAANANNRISFNIVFKNSNINK